MHFDPTKKPTGIKRMSLATLNSMRALSWITQHESAFKQELCLLILSIPLSFWMSDNTLTRLLLICAVLSILMMEIVNTAIEVIVDRIGLELNDLSGLAKDLGSLLVLLSILVATFVWAFVLYDKF